MREELARQAQENYEWFVALQEAGFTAEQAIAVITRPVVTVQHTPYPPEFFEHLERQTALANKLLADDD